MSSILEGKGIPVGKISDISAGRRESIESIGPYEGDARDAVVQMVLDDPRLLKLLNDLADGNLDNPHRVFGRLARMFEDASRLVDHPNPECMDYDKFPEGA